MVNNENFTAPLPGFQDNELNYSSVSSTNVQEENQNNYKRNVMLDPSVRVNEPFVPLVSEDNTSKSFDMRLGNTNVNTRSNSSEEHKQSGSVNLPESCMQNYIPRFEAVSDVCSPTATFKNELNAQGLNFPEGFDHTVNGSPL